MDDKTQKIWDHYIASEELRKRRSARRITFMIFACGLAYLVGQVIRYAVSQ